jgi:hypothetical protein
MESERVYLKTKYPNIFKGSYWGNFTLTDSGYHINQQIISNRNKFVEDYNLIKRVPLPYWVDQYVVQKLKRFDHVELYLTNHDEYILISSPYTNKYSDDYSDLNWSPIDKLYSVQAYTYM